MTNRVDSPRAVPGIVIVGIVLAIVLGVGLIGLAIYPLLAPSGTIPDPTPTFVRTPVVIPTMTLIAPTDTPVPTSPPPTEAPEPTEPTPTQISPPPTSPPVLPPTALPPTHTPAPSPTSGRNLSPSFSVENSVVNAGDRIWFNFSVTNPSLLETLPFGFLGASVERDGVNLSHLFQASWTGSELAPGQTLNWRDGLHINEAGTYQLRLTICYSSVEACNTGQGWEHLSGPVTVEVH